MKPEVIGGFPGFSRGTVLTLSAYATEKYRSFVGALTEAVVALAPASGLTAAACGEFVAHAMSIRPRLERSVEKSP